MDKQKTVTIQVKLSNEEARQFAQFLKCASTDTFGKCTHAKENAYTMQRAAEHVRCAIAIALTGHAPL